jgi:hypothetical protein
MPLPQRVRRLANCDSTTTLTALDGHERRQISAVQHETKTIPGHEADQISSGPGATAATPVAFVHGRWLLPSSWDRWVTLFEEAGYDALTPGWSDDPESVEEAKAHPAEPALAFVNRFASRAS